MTPIALRNRRGDLLEFAWVEDEDYPAMSAHTWRLRRAYASRRVGPAPGVTVYMHREILGLRRHPGHGAADQVDHRNGNGLDNRRSNLRIATSAQQHQNRARNRLSASGQLGVYRNRTKWLAAIYVNGVRVHLGMFENPADGHTAYLEAKAKLHPFQPTPRQA